MKFGNIISYSIVENKISLFFEKQYVLISVIKEDIIRILVPYESDKIRSQAVETDTSLFTKFTVEKKEQFIIHTDKLILYIYNDFYMEVYDQSGNLLISDYNGERENEFTLQDDAKKLLIAEGHKVIVNNACRNNVYIAKKIDKDDCFYGLGDKTGFLNKREYEYENWNSDIPQAHNEDYKALYKSIPFLICLKRKGIYGLFFDNTYHSYINVGKESKDYFYYSSDGGNLNYYIIGGNDIRDIVKNYTYLTGVTPMPQLWTLGFHQSRWGYCSKEDILEVAHKYRTLNIPCDVIHFDIDYMDSYKVFTWNEERYGKQGELFKELNDLGFKSVTIVDPGVKLEDGYFMYDEGIKNNFFVKNKEGNVYVNEVWPGEAVYPDFGRADVRTWWADHHKNLIDSGSMGIWNDMNEPASFKGELPLDISFYDESRLTTHAEMHNVYGHNMSKATYEGIKKYTNRRPFIITRACYSGSQKYSTVWTGDNQSLWSHLQMLIPQLCNLGLSGFAFCGADIGGFGADCTSELLCRWIEASFFSPLFRNHSSNGSRRQEPWQFGQQTIDINRKYINLRYRFIPYIYDLFYKGQTSGLPIMRPLVMHYGNDDEVRNMNGEFMVGEQIIVAPVLSQGEIKKMVYLPNGTWYDYWTGAKEEGNRYILRDAPLDVCPIYIKEGSIIPMYKVVDHINEHNYTELYLYTVPGAGEYTHFQDNGIDYSYKDGKYNLYHVQKDQNNNIVINMEHEGYIKYSSIYIEDVNHEIRKY